jgi:glycosyltransferase involved in cell wall biosynthesis
MRVLFLSHYFPPEVNAPASRTFEHCRAWAEAGHDVTILTCFPNHPTGRIFSGYRNRIYQREERDGLHIVRLWTFATPNEGLFKRTLNHLVFMVMAIAVSFGLKKSDVVVSTSPQFFNGLAGYLVKLIHRAPWILEIRDLWPESITAVGAVRNRTLIRVLEWLEVFAYRKANRIVVVTDAFQRHIAGRGIPTSKIVPIKNGVDLEFYSPCGKDAVLLKQWGLEGKFVVTYAGTIGMAHGLETLLDVADWLRDKPSIQVLVVGEGADKRRFVGLKDERKLTNITVVDQQPKNLMPAIWALSDACLVMLRPLEMFKSVLPSKMFEIMGMARPIILSVDGESRDVLMAARGGIPVAPGDAKAIAAAILDLAANPDRALGFGQNGRAYVTLHHDRRQLARRFESVMLELSAPLEAQPNLGSKPVNSERP